MQVLISIHALILVPDPYFNEPGYEQQMKTEQGKQQGNAYNQQVWSAAQHQLTKGACLPHWLSVQEEL